MTKQQVTENTGIVFKWGAIATALLSVGIWFNARLSAVEVTQAEHKSDLNHILKSLDRIESRLGTKP